MILISNCENDEAEENRGKWKGLRDLAFDISRVSLKSGDTLHYTLDSTLDTLYL